MSHCPREGYRFLEHTSDTYIESWGPTLEKAFTHAAEAFSDTIINLPSVEPRTEEAVEVEGHDEMELLYNWLETLLLNFDIKGMVYKEFNISPIRETTGTVRLQARIRGEKYHRERHGAKTEIKGVTYHLMTIDKKPEQVTVRFILDL